MSPLAKTGSVFLDTDTRFLLIDVGQRKKKSMLTSPLQKQTYF